MKNLFLAAFCCLLLANAFAQPNSDSLAYQSQRTKINTMLAQRRQKFGQYDVSLSKHTGIFGLQTKKDIRRSNDILMDIVRTDEQIFVQTKILLEYRTFQQSEVQNHSTETENTSLGFMKTINSLRAENEKLKQQVADSDAEQQKHGHIAMAIIMALIVGIILLLRARFVKK